MQLTFLGTGTSMGVPVIGCRCDVCMSSDRRNKRLRTSALLRVGGLNILIDAGPDLRQQALAAGINRVDAVLLTHPHADHITGLDDLRPLNFAQRSSIPIYGTEHTLALVRERFGYAFHDMSAGSSRPLLQLVGIEAATPFMIGHVQIQPLEVYHGTWTISGFRVGSLGYVTDASALPAASMAALRGLDMLVLNALRHSPHPTHFSLEEAVNVIADLQPQRALLVHMTHDLDHEATNATLPPHIQLAFDGQLVEVEDLLTSRK
jgi:phosphoribosyl 1,2-cyclic phosphate phosphodiesterase